MDINRNITHLKSDKFEKKENKEMSEFHQQLLEMEKKLTAKNLYLDTSKRKLQYRLQYKPYYVEHSYPFEYENLRYDNGRKMELDKLTFANNAYRDKKTVLSFTSEKPEVNINNLNYRMLHEMRNINSERSLLKMLKLNKDIVNGFSYKELQDQIRRLPNEEENKNKLMELKGKRDEMFINAPFQGSLWNSLPATKKLRNQIQAKEVRDEEKRKRVIEWRKKVKSKEREIKKTENEIKSLKKSTEKIRQRMQRAL